MDVVVAVVAFCLSRTAKCEEKETSKQVPLHCTPPAERSNRIFMSFDFAVARLEMSHRNSEESRIIQKRVEFLLLNCCCISPHLCYIHDHHICKREKKHQVFTRHRECGLNSICIYRLLNISPNIKNSFIVFVCECGSLILFSLFVPFPIFVQLNWWCVCVSCHCAYL